MKNLLNAISEIVSQNRQVNYESRLIEKTHSPHIVGRQEPKKPTFYPDTPPTHATFSLYIHGCHHPVPGIGIPTNHHLFQVSAPMDIMGGFKRRGTLSESYINDLDSYLNEVTLFQGQFKTAGGKPMVKASGILNASENDPNLQGNLHKKIHIGMKKADEEMSRETPQERKAKAAESRKVLDSFAASRGYKKMPSLLNGNGKTEKSSGEGVSTLGFAAAPHATNGINGFDVCPKASTECRKNCLGTEAGGNKQYPDAALSSKIIKTHALAAHPEHFHRVLDQELESHKAKSKKDKMIPGIRMNVTSDFAWEKHMPNTFKRHHDVQFYDYTKAANRVGHPDLPSNYHLSLSHTGTGHSESNDKDAVKKLEDGHVVAMVYQRVKKGHPHPTHVEDVKTGRRYPIINGDKDDNTFDRHSQANLNPGRRGHGVVSGLQLKGVTAEKAGHFANKVDHDGIIRINK